MEAQLKIISKDKAHRLIDSIDGEEIIVLTFDSKKGTSDTGRRIKKKSGQRMVDKSKVLVLSKTNPVAVLKLHNKFFENLEDYKRDDIVKIILIPQRE